MSAAPQTLSIFFFLRLIIILSRATLHRPLRSYVGLNKITTTTLPHWLAPGALGQLHFPPLHSDTQTGQSQVVRQRQEKTSTDLSASPVCACFSWADAALSSSQSMLLSQENTEGKRITKTAYLKTTGNYLSEVGGRRSEQTHLPCFFLLTGKVNREVTLKRTGPVILALSIP